IVMVSLLVPAVIKLGATTPAAHMFAFYFSILSAITPPVALAVFAAAGLAKSNMWKSGFAAMRVAAPAYIVPFMFVYEPALLLVVNDWSTQWPYVVWVVTTASIGVIALAGGLFGWLVGFASTWQRLLMIVAALCLIKPGIYSDAAGLALLAAVIGVQLVERRRLAEARA
ncbi:MAG: TRAP transporter large permease subunit, partial [Gemmatimonadaceae bacterium]